MDSLLSYDFILPATAVVVGFLIGFFVEKVVLGRLRVLAEGTEWPTDNIVFAAFRGIPVFWGGAAGIYVALHAVATDPEIIDLLEKLLVVAVLWSATIVAARIAAGLVTGYAGRGSTLLPSTSIIPNLVRLSVYVTGLLIILNTLEISIAPVLTALGVGGLAVALALQDTLSNVFAGLYLLAARQVKPGDFIRLDSGDEGYINDITWRSTVVRTIYDNLVIVPNAKLASAIVTNYHLPVREMLLRIPVGVEYDSDLERVEQVTVDVARETLREITGAEPATEPMVLFQAFGEFSLNFIVLLRVREYFDQYRVRHLFIKKLLPRYRAEGIRIPFPIREFQMQLDPEGPGAGHVEGPAYEESPFESNAPESREDRPT